MEITAEKISERLDELDGELPPNVKDALRKAKERKKLPSLTTLIVAAKSKGTTVAKLLSDKPPAPEPPQPATEEAAA